MAISLSEVVLVVSIYNGDSGDVVRGHVDALKTSKLRVVNLSHAITHNSHFARIEASAGSLDSGATSDCLKTPIASLR